MAVDGRKALYKLGSPGNVTTWKQRYREQCQQRLRDSRAKQYERLRQMEWSPSEQDTKLMASAAVMDAMEVTTRYSLTGEELPLQEVDELTKELIAEEQSLLAQYLDNLKFSEQAASAAIESSQSVVCPICQQSTLLQNRHIIFCKCGLRIDTEHDGVTLSMLQQQLVESCSYHSGVCPAPNTFTVKEQFGMTNIILSCEVCGCMYIVI